MLTNSYWNSNGKHQTKLEQVQKLIPDVGRVKGKRTRKLNKLRVASNCYYDLYNNGLYNRKAEFTRVFGFSSINYRDGNDWYDQEMLEKVEALMDKFIEEAYEEQKVMLLVMI